ncbi:MAG TPA: class I lanthipeptide [Actinomycetota bacterium]
MKKTTKKLNLPRETIGLLTRQELTGIAGGMPCGTDTCPQSGRPACYATTSGFCMTG